MNIPFYDLRLLLKNYESQLCQISSEVISSGSFILGHHLQNFERQWSAYCGSDYCIGTSNGLDALYLSLLALDIGQGDEVIVPAHTFVATWLSVIKTGAKIIPVDICKQTMLIDITKIERSITKSTKAIVAVHLYGAPVDLNTLRCICNSYDIPLIEDSAQAHGSTYKSHKIGSGNSIAAWSFYPGKNLGALGDGGAITLSDKNLYQRLLKLRNYGSTERYCHDIVGFNCRLDEIQAAFLSLRLKYLDAENALRQRNAKLYIDELSGIHEIILPYFIPDEIHAWHQFVIRVPNRRLLQDFLLERGIQTMIHYPLPPYLQPQFKFLSYAENDFPVSTSVSQSILSLPINPTLQLEQIYYIIESINMFFKE